LFESGLKEILRVDKFMYFVDNINHAWVFLHTSAPTRPSTILEEITRFNASKLSEKNRIILEKARAEDDPLVLSMTLADGKVAEKNWFYQYVNSKRGDPSFVEWISEELLAKKNRGSGAAAGGGSAVPKVDKALKKLAIQMTEKQANTEIATRSPTLLFLPVTILVITLTKVLIEINGDRS